MGLCYSTFVARLPQILTEHLMAPRCSGVLESESAVSGRGENPACGDVLVLMLDLEPDSGLLQAAFQARGCSAVIAVASLGAEAVTGMKPSEARALPIKGIVKEAGGLDRLQSHAIRVFDRALQQALHQLPTV